MAIAAVAKQQNLTYKGSIYEHPYLKQRIFHKIAGKHKKQHYTYEGQLILGERRIDVLKITQLHTHADFTQNYYEQINIECMIPISDYQSISDHLTGDARDLKFKLIKKKTKGGGYGNVVKDPTYIYYQAHIHQTAQSGTDRATTTPIKTPLDDYTKINIDLVPMGVHAMKDTVVGGIIRPGKDSRLSPLETTMAILDHYNKSILGQENLNVPMEDSIPLKFNVVESDNDNHYPFYHIPQNTKLSMLPHYLQKKYGLYAQGLGFFYKSFFDIQSSSQHNECFLFPKHRVEFNKPFGKKTLHIVKIPTMDSSRLDVTSSFENDQDTNPNAVRDYWVISHHEHRVISGRNVVEHSVGDSARSIKQQNILDKFRSVDNGRLFVDRSQNTVEQLYDKRKSTRHIPMTTSDMSSHNVFEASEILADQRASKVMIPWNESDVELLYPGMPVRYYYLKNDNTVGYMEGILQGYKHQLTTKNDNIKDTSNESSAVLIVSFIDHRDKTL